MYFLKGADVLTTLQFVVVIRTVFASVAAELERDTVATPTPELVVTASRYNNMNSKRMMLS